MLRSIIISLSVKQLCTSAIFALKVLTNCVCLELPVSPSSVELFQNNGEFGKKYLTDHRTAGTIQSFVATNGIFSALF